MTQIDFAKRLGELKASIVKALPPTSGTEKAAAAEVVLAALDIAEEFLLDIKRIADAAQR